MVREWPTFSACLKILEFLRIRIPRTAVSLGEIPGPRAFILRKQDAKQNFWADRQCDSPTTQRERLAYAVEVMPNSELPKSTDEQDSN